MYLIISILCLFIASLFFYFLFSAEKRKEIIQKEWQLKSLEELIEERKREIDSLSSLEQTITEEIEDYDNQIKEYKSMIVVLQEQDKKVEKTKLVISQEDKDDIEILKKVSNKLNKKELIDKIIWEKYYKQPYQDLSKILFPENRRYIGIYKITNIKNGKVYIGQSVDIKSRFSQHIKNGISNKNSNKFYNEMYKYNPENFSFEILEESDRSELNKKEKNWITFYDSKDNGLNTQSGNSTSGGRYL